MDELRRQLYFCRTPYQEGLLHYLEVLKNISRENFRVETMPQSYNKSNKILFNLNKINHHSLKKNKLKKS